MFIISSWCDPTILAIIQYLHSYWTLYPFVSAFRIQNALYEGKNESQAFGNISKRAFSKKLRFEMKKIEPKRVDRFEELLQMQKCFWSILPLEMQGMTQITLISLTTKYTENWKDKQPNLKIIATICRNLHCQSHSQQPNLNLLTWLRLSNEEEF